MPGVLAQSQGPLITRQDGNGSPNLRHDTNVGPVERIVSGTLGGTLIGYGLTHRNVVGMGAIILGGALAFHGLKRHSPLYSALGLTGEDSDASPLDRRVHSRSTTTIAAPAEELYDLWRDVDSLARYFPHVSSVRALDGARSQWTATLPGDQTVRWSAEITEDEPGKTIAWAADPDSPFEHEGSIRFSPAAGNRGTSVILELSYHLPGGVLGVLLAKTMLADPQMEAPEALRRLKQWVEAGEISVNTSPSVRGLTQGSLRRSLTPGEGAASNRNRGDEVDRASMDSFPASDPPSYTGASASRGQAQPEHA